MMQLGLQSNVSAEVRALTDRLEEADGDIPADFSRADMDLFMEAAPGVVAELLENIYENSEAIGLPAMLPSENLKTDSIEESSERSDTFTEYNVDTGEETTRIFSEVAPLPNATDDVVTDGGQALLQSPGSSSIMPRAVYSGWHEQNPQNYDDTKTTCRLIILKKGGGQFSATGYLVSNTTMLTASHCIYNPDALNGWCDYLIIMPAVSGKYPTGYYGTATSTTVVVGNYNILNTKTPGDDWGIAKLSKNFWIGYFGTISFGSGNQKYEPIRVQGYPNPNKPGNMFNNNNMYLHTGECTADISGYLKTGSAKAYDGMSGGPALVTYGGKYVAAGIIVGQDSKTFTVVYAAFDTYLHNLIKSYK